MFFKVALFLQLVPFDFLSSVEPRCFLGPVHPVSFSQLVNIWISVGVIFLWYLLTISLSGLASGFSAQQGEGE